MRVNLVIGMTVDTEKLDDWTRSIAVEDCDMAGFPVSEENIAWCVAEGIARESNDLPGVRCEMIP